MVADGRLFPVAKFCFTRETGMHEGFPVTTSVRH